MRFQIINSDPLSGGIDGEGIEMDLMRFRVTPLIEEHVAQVTELWRVAMTEAIGIAPIHSFESQAYFLQNILPEHYQVQVVQELSTGEPVAFMANNHNDISQLYVSVDYQRIGIGSHLLKLAQSECKGSLTLRTFEVNKSAQCFYEKHGFIAIGGNSDNEEGLPDIVYYWQNRQVITE